MVNTCPTCSQSSPQFPLGDLSSPTLSPSAWASMVGLEAGPVNAGQHSG